MAIDGSFNLHFELDRFLARCPRISALSEFDSLLKKGKYVKEEEVVRTVGELFLHPNYTIPVVGCFRPLMHKILERVVGLLHKVPDLRSNLDQSDSLMVEFDEGKFLREDKDLDSAELVHVVDVYCRCGKGLNLHEIACLAFCRALDMDPFLLRHVLDYFQFAPPPFERIKSMKYSSKALANVGNELLNVVRASYRFLLAEPEVFITLWDWSSFLDFGHLLANIDQFDDEFLKRNIMDLRWCGLQILSFVMKMRDKASSEADIGTGEAFFCLQRWKEFCQDVSLEKASWHVEFSGARRLDTDTSVVECAADASNFTDSPLIFTSEFDDILAPKIGSWPGRTAEKPFVLTAALKNSFEMVSLAVIQKWPILLRGPPGSGKTALINKLAQDKKSQVFSMHMDEHIDGKTLLGSYVCTEQPGEFRWQPGSLTQAISRGFWVIFEDIGKAPADVHSILLPLLENSSSFLTGHGEAIRVHEGFRLFSTITSSKLDTTEGKNSLSGLWRRVSVPSPGDEDLVNVVNVWFPELCSLTGRLIETFNQMNQLSGFQYRSTSSFGSHGRFSSRDLLKWCRRITALGISFVGEALSSIACDSIYKEAVDVFAAYSTTTEKRLALMKEIARLWAVSIEEAVQPVNKPVIQELRGDLRVGRILLSRNNVALGQKKKRFVKISSSVHTLERIACSVKFNEPVLLVGETGAGKTTLVQNLATRVGQRLTVLNLSQQSDVADLLGGFQPNNVQSVMIPLYNEFGDLFNSTFSSEGNRKYLDRLQVFVTKKDWDMLFTGFRKGVEKILQCITSGSGTEKKRKRPLDENLLKRWESFSLKLEIAHAQVSGSGGMIFSFVEGAFVSALKNGEWILLDEVNLAPPEILQRLTGVLEEEKGSLCLSERGDIDYVYRHPNFRIFACMNPATDTGKRDLPLSVRGRFTEYFVDDVLSDEDLFLFIKPYLDDGVSIHGLASKIVKFYKEAKKESEVRLQDGANQKPQYSLRSLYRALEYTMKAGKKGFFQKALYDGFCMFFLTLLDEASAKLMNQMIVSYLLEGKMPMQVSLDAFLLDREMLLAENSDPFLERYVMTKSVTEHLNVLARAVFVGRYPVLLQGPTSSGKTSLVKYLAAKTGHKFVRINNHEHTDLQEYLGSYITNSKGKLVFQEGALVKAVRSGHWIVLDELNLAPSDVLEALNRLLDDNRELYVPELREVVRPHPKFMLFATQNPPNVYGGRKMLSRAFRNRFVEIHVDEIPQDELTTILEKRCEVPPSYAKLMVNVMKDLQVHRQTSKVFAGKEGYITPRDLFRWASRYKVLGNSKEDLARDGYYLLAERLREDTERRVVREVLEKRLRVDLPDVDEMYKLEAQGVDKITWTKSMSRLYFLVERCYKLREPVLLVGETGGGKTTVCQLLSLMLHAKLHMLNCHQYSETSDFIGGFYPVRERSAIISEYKELCDGLNSKAHEFFISSDINHAPQTLDKLSAAILSGRQGQMLPIYIPLEKLNSVYEKLHDLHYKWQSIFIWQDGPLIEAMKKGDLFLIDEISLADDSVLERLNSVLEPERKLSLAEKGGPDLENITANSNFFLLATMNPGGDYGKKELSPALRNRFTEIWVPSVSDLDELRCIGLEKISSKNLAPFVDVMLNFWDWFNHLETGRMLTIRDFLSWVSFVNLPDELLEPEHALLHGAFLVLLDGLNLGTNLSKSDAVQLRKKSLAFLLEQLEASGRCLDQSTLPCLEYYGWSDPATSADKSGLDTERMQGDNRFGIHPFYIERGNDNCDTNGFEFFAPTTRRNAMRVLRAMQLAKPVLLEGSPGVGKTSLIVAIGKYSGHNVVRINLSEQTDIMDLLGSDLPVESDQGMQFAWSDGILLQALKMGSWVLLDELNLAPQSVLEGLNSILDHRAEVFIPELGQTFGCPASFRIFACQNPSHQGGGRKGLPKSFLNRFTKVYVDELCEDDYMSICMSLYPSIARPILGKLIAFNKRLHEETMLHHNFGQDGSPWEFNLRDVARSCEMIQGAHELSKADCFLDTVYVQRMRTSTDRVEVMKLYEQVFGCKPYSNFLPRLQINPQYLVVGNTSIKRNPYQACGHLNSQLKILPGSLSSLEAVSNCVRHKWLCIVVGPPSSGKTSLVRLLATLTGNVLNEVNLSPATDTSELLGCFEQHDAFRCYRLVIAQVERFVNEYASLELNSSVNGLMRRKDLLSRWLGFVSTINSKSSTSSNVEMWRTKCKESVPLLLEIIENLRFDLEKKTMDVSWSIEDLDRSLAIIKKFQESCLRGQHTAKFEWITGLLINAIEKGEWIVLDNANLCNPTVLDRINSLVEHSGSITVNECGIVDGQPVVLHPHPQFRMFLTVNPSYGEVSRAMRNRGVEVYLMQPSQLLVESSGHTLEEAQLRDVKRFVVLSGVPYGRLVDMMSKAHIYARNEGTKLGVSITLLELAHWVQLFKQLITRGNQPIWSLQVSWEHTYSSPLGENTGKIAQAISSYLSATEILRTNKFQDSILCLPGGWPTPLNMRDFVLYSRETCVRRNCMYLEFLGKSFSNVQSLGQLYQLLFPRASLDIVSSYSGQEGFNLELANKMLFFAANWTIEQALESDIELYLCWLGWFGSRVEPLCSFFKSYVDILKEEFKHPIWDQIFCCRGKLLHHHSVDLDALPIPILSMDLVALSSFNVELMSETEHLRNSINSVGLARHSYQQWRSETQHTLGEEAKLHKPLLEALQIVEKKVLESLVGSQSFDVVFKLYEGLLESHKQLWCGLTSSNSDSILVSRRALVKIVSRFHNNFPSEVDNFMKEINYAFSDSLRSQKSLLWKHGGHPCVPFSGDIYLKQRQLISCCELVWPNKKKSWGYVGSEAPIEDVLSFDSELRSLAMMAVSMSAFVGKSDDDDFKIIQQLDEMYLMLVQRLESEKNMLEARLESSRHSTWLADSSTCCSFPLDLTCRRSGFSSWQAEFPICDDSSFFQDTVLLHKLSRISLFDVQEQYPDLMNLMIGMQCALDFAINFSSRNPMQLVPHQNILWTLDSLLSIPDVNTKIAGYVLEMWSSWHKLLWIQYDLPQYVLNGDYADGVRLPHRLFRLMKTETVERMLQGSSCIGDFHLQSLKLRVVSFDLWRGCHNMDIKDFLLSAAQSLFQKIIYSHRKSFSTVSYDLIKCTFSSFMAKNVTEDDIKTLVYVLASSNHGIFISCLESLILPVLRGLYMNSGAESLVKTIGCVWFRIGCLRYHLLTLGNDLDPAAKYSTKYSHLVGKIASLELDINVRRECDLLAGCSQLREADDYRANLLGSLHSQQIGMQRQMVFRPDSGNYRKLKHKLDEIRNFVESCTGWMNNGCNLSLKEIIIQVQEWQVTATSFMDHLSSEYSAYVDVVEPIQVAIHEIKLGLSLVLSSAISERVLERLGQQNMDLVLDSVYSFMQFPRKSSSRSVIVEVEKKQYSLSSSEIQWPCKIESVDLQILEHLIASTTMDSAQNLRFAFYKNILHRVAHSIAESHLLDNASFVLLSKYFGEFASSWMHMRHGVRKKEDDSAQKFKFKPRAFGIENVIDLDISTLKGSVAVEIFQEWKEFHAGEEFKEGLNNDEVTDPVDENWNAIEESVLSGVVDIHNQLFGSVDLVKLPGVVDVPDEEKVSSFTDSYSLGIQMVRSLEGTVFSDFDSKLILEHILRISIEREHQYASPHKSGHVYNFYKHPNAPVMAKVVEPVVNLKQRMHVLLNEWDGHPALQKLLDAVEMLLALPLSTPLAKVLSGLEFLLNRVWALQETVAKVPLEEHLKPVLAFVSSLQKLEFESGLALLSEVQVQFEENAARLWYPLYSVLQPSIDEFTEHTIKSLNEFIDLSNIGEFKRRLQLLVAFHGQIFNGVRQGCYSSPHQVETLAILYNSVGFYIQFLPKISEHIEASRRDIEAKLKDLKKLYQWENTVDYVTIEKSKRGRKKLRTIVEEFTDLLRQPVSLFLAQEVTKHDAGLSMQSPSDLAESFKNSRKILELVHHQANLRDDDRLLWFFDSLKKLDLTSEATHLAAIESAGFFFKDLEGEVTRFIEDGVSPNFLLNKGTEIWDTMGNVCNTVIGCCDIWGDEQKSLKKRRVFTDLLKLLESCGLSKHRSNSEETVGKKSGYWLLQPSYDIRHLLSNGCVDSSAQSSSKCLSPGTGSLYSEWTDANSFYFKGLASMQLMQQTCLNFHKDFTLEQVKRCGSFVEHLLEILQDHRAVAYDFANQLNNLRQCVWPLANMFSESVSGADCVEWCFTSNQDAIFNCMWQQKQLLGDLSTMMCEVRILQQKDENNHLNSCPNMKAAMKQISGLMESFFPGIQNLKDSLDLHLLGNNKVIADPGALLHPLGVTKEMGLLVDDIFEYVRTFMERLHESSRQGNEGEAFEHMITGHFKDVFKMATVLKKQYDSDLEVRNECQDMIDNGNHHMEPNFGNGVPVSVCIQEFQNALNEIYISISDALYGMLSEKNKLVVDEESSRNISKWKNVFETKTQTLKLEDLRDGLVKLNTVYGKLLNGCIKTDPRLWSLVSSHLKHLYSALNVILAFGDGLLLDFLRMHRMVSAVAHALGDIFSSLFAKGFGTPVDQENESDTQQDATGTGMGEGTGVNDVSEQIEDEDQLLGLSEKLDKKQDGASDASNKDDKGIEMEQDFDADALSVSEESGDDNEEDGETGDEQLESAMGETGDSGEIAKEKPLDKNDDESPPDINEKDESGQCIKDNGTIDKELRAKSDTASASEAGEDVPEDFDPQDEKNGDEDAPPDMEDADMDNEDPFSDIGALNPDEPNKWSDDDDDDDDDADETNGTEPMESHGNEDLLDDTDIEMGEHNTDGMDETLAEEKGPDSSKTDNQEDYRENDGDMNSTHQIPEETISKSGIDPVEDIDMPSFELSNLLEPNVATDSGNVGPGAKWAEGGDHQQDLAPSCGLPDYMHSELPVSGTSSGGKLGNDSFAAPIPQETSNQKIKPNPLRNIGDALDSWKERVKVSVDLEEKNSGGDDVNDEAADEYGYTAEFEKGTAQALGPATADQVEKDMTEGDLDNSLGIKEMEEDHVTDMEVENQSSDKNHNFGSVPISRNALERLPEKMELGEQPEELAESSADPDDDTMLSRSLVSVSRSYLSEDASKLSKLSLNDELGKSNRLEEVSGDVRDTAAMLWRRYELSTTRLSQELAEQLRLIMEPTLASKLQGDYKTGKRINMKKVISYIASHYRKDKIWLRRTRPNKRDYQVVIAVDDSGSMQEGKCGNFAIEALVTVCRAMSQLEVGKLAVASFGKTGNIKVLHDFDQPFTGEAGIKMISSLTFNQDNTNADEPMADLLKYLDNMLDSAVVNARLPSGHNPLQQLVLIIGDGKFQEKESLKRRIRDILNKGCMVAYLVLDSPDESKSIMKGLEVVSVRGGNVVWSNYMDSFPFPYYVVLKNVEALPQTLADLLRQWFELMQNSRD